MWCCLPDAIVSADKWPFFEAMISHDYWLGAFVHSVRARGKGSCVVQQICRFKRCACTDDQIDGDLVIIGLGGYLFLETWFVYSICWVTLIWGSSGADLFWNFSETLNDSLYFMGGVLVVWARKVFEYWWSILTREFEFLTLLFNWVLDFWLILLYQGNICDFSEEELLGHTLNFELGAFVSKLCWYDKEHIFFVGINISDIGIAIKAGIQAGGIRDLALAVCLISNMFM